MFCPKCGTKNPDDGKFCRSCGLELGNVSAAMTGDLAPLLADLGIETGDRYVQKEAIRRKDPAEVYGDGVKELITGFGFLVVSLVLFFTGVAGGRAWWWAMLFPAFFISAKGLSDLLKSRKMQALRSQSAFTTPSQNSLGTTRLDGRLGPAPARSEISPGASSYKTGDLVPPSVTDGTTRHLEFNAEGETMTLPKK